MEKRQQNNPDMRSAIVVFAKEPQKIPAKTRIAATHGTAVAERIYQQLLEATEKILRELTYYVAYTPVEEPCSVLKGIFSTAQGFIAQSGEELGARLNNVCSVLHTSLDYQGVICIGTDCPWLTAEDIRDAAYVLQSNDVVIGPARDGGYYLIGVRENANSVFTAKNWGTSALLEETVSLITQNNLQHALLDVKNDVDYYEDYITWQKKNS